jgi:arylsulfatase A-like enzyme
MKTLRTNLMILVGMAACTVAAAEKPASQPDKPNVLFLFADDQRADTIAALGNRQIRTPSLDRLCHQGLSFSRAYMQGAFGGATCVPSRAMLLSGQSLFHTDVDLVKDETWPEAFARAGYATFVSGKWHNGPASLRRCFQSGRALFVGGMSKNPLNESVRDLADGKLSPSRPVDGHLCAAFADETIAWLKQPHQRPFFCYIAFDAPHDPHIVPPNFPVKYDPRRISLPPNFLPAHPFNNGEMHVRDEQLLPQPRPEAAVRRMIAEYYRYISFLDAQIGRILDALAASPYGKNTIVVFSADSGVARGSHGLIGKQNLYEYDSVRVPLIVAGPGIPAGKSTDALCYLYDVLPTLGARCGVAAPPHSDGRNFNAVLSTGRGVGRESLVFAYRHVQRAIATSEWKLIRYPQANQTQLFDLRNDPYEIHNLVDKPEYAARVAELSARMKRELAAAGDNNPRRGAGK